MNISSVLLLIVCVAGVAGGQIMFKIASRGLQGGDIDILRAATQPALVLGLLIYLLAALMWLWILRTVRLSDAYPFIALSFVIVPILSMVFLGEEITARYWLGSFLIIVGIILMVRA